MLKTRVYYWHETQESDLFDNDGHIFGFAMPVRSTHGLAINENGHLVYAEALCHWKDQFNKRVGRAKVEGRIKGKAQKLYWEFTSLDQFLQSRLVSGGPEFQDVTLAEKLAKLAYAHQKNDVA